MVSKSSAILGLGITAGVLSAMLFESVFIALVVGIGIYAGYHWFYKDCV